MRPTVGIDVTPMLYRANGIGRCTRSLVAEITRAAPDLEFVLFGRRLAGANLARGGFEGRTVHLRLPRRAETFIKALGLVERSCRADLYHATDFYSPLKHPERAVATIHDVIFLKNPEPMVDHQRLARWVGGFARRCRAIITCSEWCKREIVEVLDAEPSRVHVIYWGVDRTTFRPEPDIEALRHRLRSQVGITWPYFLAVACSTGRKNTPRLLRAFDKFVEQGGDHNLVAVWDPPAEVRREFDHHVAAGRLRFTGHVSDVLLRDLYAGATATIYPSLNEGFGLPMLESMSCGTPVIASDATCLPEIAGDAAVYVDPHNENAIAAAMTTFEDGSASRPALRERGLVRAAQFTWENCAARTATVYRAALA